MKTKKCFYATLFIMERHYWFKAKTSQFGWTIDTWKGWSVIVLWVVMIIATVRYAFMGIPASGDSFLSFIKLIALWSLLFVIILWKKIEPPYFFKKDSDDHEGEK